VNQEDLLDIIDYDESIEAYESLAKALRAVVQLHNPCCDNLTWLHTGYCVFCSQTKLTKYPCRTIQAIEEALV
jgi:hypothetical protein